MSSNIKTTVTRREWHRIKKSLYLAPAITFVLHFQQALSFVVSSTNHAAGSDPRSKWTENHVRQHHT